MAAAIPKHRQLPDKENKLFRELLTQYEYKQYKKAIKAADTILKKFPNHGETLALKALTLHSSLPEPPTASSIPKKEEAEGMARLAVKKDITSHITWHILGILAKNRKDWDEASRAFTMARKQDPDNIPLIRDAISLLTHTRHYSQALQARHHYTMLRPQIRASWLGLVVAHELVDDKEEAIKTYDLYQSTLQKDGATGPEKAQVLFHMIELCVEIGKYEEALERLDKGVRDGIISAQGEVSEIRARILTNLGRTEETSQAYSELLKQNPDKLEFYHESFKSQGIDIGSPLDDLQRNLALNTLDEYAKKFPQSAAPRRLSLNVAQGDKFRELASAYIIKGLERGVPSLFVDIKSVYVDQEKMRIVGNIVEDLVARLEKDATLAKDDTIAPPTVLLWAYYFLALHLSHPLNPSPSYSRSITLLDTAIFHTPTLPELYMAKAMIMKRAGDYTGAAYEIEKARKLDGQDRFLNVKAAKYWLKAGETARAEELFGLFTKKGISPVQDLTDLQSSSFLLQSAHSYLPPSAPKPNLGMAIKRFSTVIKVFQDLEDDQYDFHSYCLRRMTLSSYVKLLKYEDQLRSHIDYSRGAIGAIEIYLKVHDDPSLTEEKLSPEEEAERKKATKKAQKAEAKAKKVAAASGDKKEEAPLPDDDPNGLKLLKTETPLDDALKIWKTLETLRSEEVETWIWGYEIYMRKKLYLAALRCLLHAHAISSSNPDVHVQILNFSRITSSLSDVPQPVIDVITKSLPTFVPAGKTPEALNEEYMQAHSSEPEGILAAAKGRLEIDAEDVVGAVDVLKNLLNFSSAPSIPTLFTALSVINFKSPEKAEELRKLYAEKLPLAWSLKTLEEQEERKRQLQEEAEEAEIQVDGKADA
ncbi:uncharacterized protein L203_105454 [Cryptococcus depauperatus CBS 7841]|uniref:Peptide alpha-N-acetyltransferase n=1 Tax=Cryptococcus depauperatus CBS 7841 TaxID=1295531 RepID=A0AAJ8JXD6_9TREE